MSQQKLERVEVDQWFFPVNKRPFGYGYTSFGEKIHIGSHRRGQIICLPKGRKVISVRNLTNHEGDPPTVIMAEIAGRARTKSDDELCPYAVTWAPFEEWESVRVDANPVS